MVLFPKLKFASLSFQFYFILFSLSLLALLSVLSSVPSQHTLWKSRLNLKSNQLLKFNLLDLPLYFLVSPILFASLLSLRNSILIKEDNMFLLTCMSLGNLMSALFSVWFQVWLLLLLLNTLPHTLTHLSEDLLLLAKPDPLLTSL